MAPDYQKQFTYPISNKNDNSNARVTKNDIPYPTEILKQK